LECPRARMQADLIYVRLESNYLATSGGLDQYS
jgi:hypothetical protein